MRLTTFIGLLVLAASTAACGGGGEPGAATATAPPARRGDVWEVQGPLERTDVPGAIVAFVNGVHVMVVDGNRVYAGMTELAVKDGSNGARTITFPSGLSADLVSSGSGAELKFSTGERIGVKERAE